MLGEIRRRARHVLVPTLALAALVYIGAHAATGERGVLAWWRLTNEIGETRAALATAGAARAAMARRVALMRPDNLDLDMLDERVRAVLLLAHPGDLVIRRTPTEDPGMEPPTLD